MNPTSAPPELEMVAQEGGNSPIAPSTHSATQESTGSHYKMTDHKVQQMTNLPQSAIAARSVGTEYSFWLT